jgi:hypothetical protein
MLKRRNFWESPLASPLSIKGQRKVPELDTINRPGSMKENYQQTQQQISAPPVLAVVLIWISYYINFRLLTGWHRRASPSRHFAWLNIKSTKIKKGLVWCRVLIIEILFYGLVLKKVKYDPSLFSRHFKPMDLNGQFCSDMVIVSSLCYQNKYLHESR